jgi:hypothetical protein
VFVDAARADALARVCDEQRLDVRRRHFRGRHVAERGSDAADRLAATAAVRRARLREHRTVVAQRRRLGALHELDVLEPGVRARSVGPPAAASRAASSAARARDPARSASTSSTNTATRRRAWNSVR